MAESPASEAQKLQEQSLTFGDTASKLVRPQDTVFDGKNLRLGTMELDPELQQVDINKMQKELGQLLEQTKISGLYINCLGKETAPLPVSSSATLIFLCQIRDILNRNPDYSPDNLIKKAFKGMWSYFDDNELKITDIDFAAVLVAKDGTVTAINTTGNAIMIVRADGTKETIDPSGVVEHGKPPEVQQRTGNQKMKAGDKIVLCAKDAVNKINSQDSVSQIVDKLVGTKDNPSAAAGQTTEKGKPAAAELPVAPAAVKEGQPEAQAEKKVHQPPYFVDTKQTETVDGFKTKYGEWLPVAKSLMDEAKKILPKNSGESDFDYDARVSAEVEKRLRFSGDFQKTEDAVYELVKRHPNLEKPYLVLMALEVAYADDLQKANQETQKQYDAELARVFRRDVKTEVVHVGEPAFVEGDLEHIFDEDIKMKELPKKDLFALTLVADRLLDIEADGGGTYPAQMRRLMEAKNGRDLTELRRKFYQMTIESIRYIDTSARFLSDSPQAKMIEILKNIRQEKNIKSLIDSYQGVKTGKGAGLREGHKKEMLQLLDQDPQNLLDYALKGADLMDRRISLALKLHEIPPIFYKTFYQGPATLQEFAGVVEVPEAIKPPAGTAVVEMPPPAVEVPAATPATIEARPVVEQPPEVRPVVEIPEAAPQPKDGEKRPEPSVIPPPPPPAELQTNFVLGAAALKDRRVQNVLQLAEHVFAQDLDPSHQSSWYRARDKVLGWSYKIPIVGGVIRAVTHPVQMIWQNGLARSVFEQQHIRFVSDMVDTVKQTSDKTIPIEVTPELLEKALENAREQKKQANFFKKLGWTVTDTLQGLTGIAQTSEQRLAKQWLAQELPKPADQRDQELQQIESRTLEEQTKLGERYATLPGGIDLDRANRLILAQGTGETRHQIEDNPQLIQETNQRVKALIENYANNTLTDDQLVKEINTYLLGDFRAALSPQLQEEFSAPEVASNILSIADTVKSNWARYQSERSENGRTKWEELEINILFGKGEWGGVRGKKEMGFLAEKLARRLAESPGLSEKTMAGGVALAKDVLTNAAFFGAGYGLSALTFASNMPLRLVGGLAGIGAGAALKETGIGFSALGIKGIKGRYIKEVEQLSREAARGRLTPDKARIRKEMAAALVDRQKGTDIATNIEQLIQRQELSATEAKTWLIMLADADARMRLSDLSGSRAMNFKVQNYIQFTEGSENEEYLRLRGALLNGMVKLQAAGQSTTDFDKYSTLAEAQLRVGDKAETIKRWLVKDSGLTQQQADDLVTNLLPDINLNIGKESSLRGKEATIRKLAIKRGISTGVKAALTGFVAPVVYSVPVAGLAEVSHFVSESLHAGVGQYFQDWNNVVHGNVPLALDRAGNVVSDLSPLQKGTLHAINIKEPPFPSGAHDTVIDGLHLQLPGGLRYTEADLDHNGVVDHDVIVDIRSGNVLVDMSNGKLGIDAGGKLIFTDNGGHVIDATASLAKAGINVIKGPDLTVNILTPSGTQSVAVDGHATTIPNGSEWIKDTASGKWDLVVSSDHTKVLVNDAQFDSSGHMTATSINPALKYTEVASGVFLKGPDAATELAKHGTAIDHREWYSYDQPGSQGNELRLYTFKDGDAVILDMSKMQMAHQQGLNPNPINVQDVINNHEGGFALSLPNHAGHPIWISDGADGVWNGHLRLDPNDNIHTVTFSDGSTHTLGEIARWTINQKALSPLNNGDIATEVYGRQDVFNLGVDGKAGFIEAGRVVDHGGNAVLQTFATIRGLGEATVSGGFTPQIDLTETLQTSTPTFALEAPSQFIPWFIPLPSRENIEKSVRGKPKEVKETTVDMRPAEEGRPTTAQPTTPQVTTPASSEIKGKRKQLDELAEAIRKKEEGGGDARDEREKLRQLALEIVQLEAQLSGAAPEKNKQLNQQIIAAYEGFRQASEAAGEVQAGWFPSAGKFMWQGVRYGNKRKSEGDDSKTYRGYLMIEPTDFPKALDLLEKIGKARKGERKRLEFKWLVLTYPRFDKPQEMAQFLTDKNNWGTYNNLGLTDPRIAIYGDSADEVKEILTLLAQQPNWQEIEDNRIRACGGQPKNAPRRPGTNAFQIDGKEYRSLNYNDGPGYSEDEAADENWRDFKVGARSVRLDH